MSLCEDETCQYYGNEFHEAILSDGAVLYGDGIVERIHAEQKALNERMELMLVRGKEAGIY